MEEIKGQTISIELQLEPVFPRWDILVFLLLISGLLSLSVSIYLHYDSIISYFAEVLTMVSLPILLLLMILVIFLTITISVTLLLMPVQSILQLINQLNTQRLILTKDNFQLGEKSFEWDKIGGYDLVEYTVIIWFNDYMVRELVRIQCKRYKMINKDEIVVDPDRILEAVTRYIDRYTY